jgi:hypothetical protein
MYAPSHRIRVSWTVNTSSNPFVGPRSGDTFAHADSAEFGGAEDPKWFGLVATWFASVADSW